MSIVLTGIYWLARDGFETSPWPMVRAIGLALILINTPYAARLLIRKKTLEYGWGSSYSFLWLATIVITAALGWLVPLIRFSPFIPLAAIAVIGFAVLLVDWLRHSGTRSGLALIGSSALFAAWAGGVVWGRIYKSPLFMEMLMSTGHIHHDVLAVAALGNVLRTYDVASVGLDGTAYMAYHWGTPWLFAQWSNLAGFSVMEFYQLVVPVTMIPFFFGGVIAFALEGRYAIFQRRVSDLRVAYASGSLAFDPRLGPTFWVVFLAATVGFMPIEGMDTLGVWTSNVMISESYSVAVPVALLLLATTIVFWQCGGNAVLEGRGTIKDYVFLVIVLPATIVALGYLKISLMILAFVGIIFAGIRLGAYRRWYLVAIGVLLTALVAFTYPRVSLAAHREGIVPFDFLKGYVPLQWWPFFFLFHLFWSLLYICLRLRSEGARTLGDVASLSRNGRILDVELVLLIALVGVAPGMVMHIDGGSAFYFSDVQRWLSVGLLLAGGSSLIPRLGRRRWTELKTIGLAFVVLPFAIATARNSVYWPVRMLRANAQTRIELYPESERAALAPRISELRRLRDPVKLASGLAAARNTNQVRGLVELDGLSLQQKARMAVFVPQSEEKYWSMLTRDNACSFSSFLVPSLTGMVMIDGMPPVGCTLSPYYGLSVFRKRTQPQTAADETPDALCVRARRLGLQRVLVVRFDEAGRISKRPAECRTK